MKKALTLLLAIVLLISFSSSSFADNQVEQVHFKLQYLNNVKIDASEIVEDSTTRCFFTGFMAFELSLACPDIDINMMIHVSYIARIADYLIIAIPFSEGYAFVFFTPSQEEAIYALVKGMSSEDVEKNLESQHYEYYINPINEMYDTMLSFVDYLSE